MMGKELLAKFGDELRVQAATVRRQACPRLHVVGEPDTLNVLAALTDRIPPAVAQQSTGLVEGERREL
jgi:hypothetical protein